MDYSHPKEYKRGVPTTVDPARAGRPPVRSTVRPGLSRPREENEQCLHRRSEWPTTMTTRPNSQVARAAERAAALVAQNKRNDAALLLYHLIPRLVRKRAQNRARLLLAKVLVELPPTQKHAYQLLIKIIRDDPKSS